MVGAAGCGGGGGGSTDIALIGTWVLTGLVVDGVPQTVDWTETVIVRPNRTFRVDSDEGGSPSFVSGTVVGGTGNQTLRVIDASDPELIGETQGGSYSTLNGNLIITATVEGELHERTYSRRG